MVSRPILNGAACAIAGVGNLNVASAAPAAVPAINLRRVTLRDIGFLPLSPRVGLHILSGLVRAFLISQHGRIQQENQKAASQAVVASATDRSKPIIGQCIPFCKARLRRCAAARRFGPIAAGASRGWLCDGNEHPNRWWIYSVIPGRGASGRVLGKTLASPPTRCRRLLQKRAFIGTACKRPFRKRLSGWHRRDSRGLLRPTPETPCGPQPLECSISERRTDTKPT